MGALERAFIPSVIWNKAEPEQARAIWEGLNDLPEKFKEALLDRAKTAPIASVEKAVFDMAGSALELSASDAAICEHAARRAGEVREMLMAMSASSVDCMFETLRGYCREFGAKVPDGVLLAGLCARMTNAAWWRRQIRRDMARKVEANAIGLGFVHRRAGLYVSDEAVTRHGQQQARNAAALKETKATNEEGQEMTLEQLASVGVSNPKLRRMELMTRIAGFEECAKTAGHVGMFYTSTAPSRMHARLSKTGKENPKFDGTTPKECAGYMAKTWAKARAYLHRRGITIYGFRVAEPHHDGTPHWHMLFFMLPAVVESVTECLRKYFSESDSHELESVKAMDARFNKSAIDWSRGSAAGYISKYIAKNIDGQKNDGENIGAVFDEDDDGGIVEVADSAAETAPRVLAWASTWGIRQFQQIGGPGVTIWRELRRLRELEHQGDLFEMWQAVSVAKSWQRYTDLNGGPVCQRKDRPVQLWREEPEGCIDFNGEIVRPVNGYGEEIGKTIKGVFLNRPCLGASHLKTRLHVWTIHKAARRGQVAEVTPEQVRQGAGRRWLYRASAARPLLTLAPGVWRPWSPVNNCTPSKKDADGFDIGGFSERGVPAVMAGHEQEKINLAMRAALLASVSPAALAARRKGGAFGRFPRLPGIGRAGP